MPRARTVHAVREPKMKTLFRTAALITALAPAMAFAAGGGVVGTMAVDGVVSTHCSGGTVSSGDSVFALGVMVDTATDLLLDNLSAPPKTMVGAFCSTASTITVAATPMTPSQFTGAPPAGFSDAVDYTTTASGWTTNPAVFTTDAASNPNATQQQPAAFGGVITVAVSGFTPVGGTALRMVADPTYVGHITITLAAAS